MKAFKITLPKIEFFNLNLGSEQRFGFSILRIIWREIFTEKSLCLLGFYFGIYYDDNLGKYFKVYASTPFWSGFLNTKILKHPKFACDNCCEVYETGIYFPYCSEKCEKEDNDS